MGQTLINARNVGKLSPEEQRLVQAKAREKGLNPDRAIVVTWQDDDSGKISHEVQETSGIGELLGAQSATSIVPAMTTMIGVGAGRELVKRALPMAAKATPLGKIASFVAPLVPGLGFGMSTAKVQDSLAKAYGPKVAKDIVDKATIQRLTQKWGSTLASIPAFLTTGRPGLKPGTLGTTAVRETGKDVAKRVAAAGGINTAIEAGLELAREGSVDIERALAAGVAGGLTAKPHRLSTALERRGGKLVDLFAGSPPVKIENWRTFPRGGTVAEQQKWLDDSGRGDISIRNATDFYDKLTSGAGNLLPEAEAKVVREAALTGAEIPSITGASARTIRQGVKELGDKLTEADAVELGKSNHPDVVLETIRRREASKVLEEQKAKQAANQATQLAQAKTLLATLKTGVPEKTEIPKGPIFDLVSRHHKHLDDVDIDRLFQAESPKAELQKILGDKLTAVKSRLETAAADKKAAEESIAEELGLSLEDLKAPEPGAKTAVEMLGPRKQEYDSLKNILGIISTRMKPVIAELKRLQEIGVSDPRLEEQYAGFQRSVEAIKVRMRSFADIFKPGDIEAPVETLAPPGKPEVVKEELPVLGAKPPYEPGTIPSAPATRMDIPTTPGAVGPLARSFVPEGAQTTALSFVPETLPTGKLKVAELQPGALPEDVLEVEILPKPTTAKPATKPGKPVSIPKQQMRLLSNLTTAKLAPEAEAKWEQLISKAKTQEDINKLSADMGKEGIPPTVERRISVARRKNSGQVDFLGLDSGARAVFNTALDLAQLSVRAGKAVESAVSDAIEGIKKFGKEFNEGRLKSALSLLLAPKNDMEFFSPRVFKELLVGRPFGLQLDKEGRLPAKGLLAKFEKLSDEDKEFIEISGIDKMLRDASAVNPNAAVHPLDIMELSKDALPISIEKLGALNRGADPLEIGWNNKKSAVISAQLNNDLQRTDVSRQALEMARSDFHNWEHRTFSRLQQDYANLGPEAFYKEYNNKFSGDFLDALIRVSQSRGEFTAELAAILTGSAGRSMVYHESNVYPEHFYGMAGPVEILVHGKGNTLFMAPHFIGRNQNLYGWVRGYKKDLPDGRKVLVIAEIQPEWLQTVRRDIKKLKDFRAEKEEGLSKLTSEAAREDALSAARDEIISEFHLPSTHMQPNITASNFYEAYDQIMTIFESRLKDVPGLKTSNALLLKAAAKHASDMGYDGIFISDAETAMMTEGHTRIAEAIRLVDVPVYEKPIIRDGKRTGIFQYELWRFGGSRLSGDKFVSINFRALGYGGDDKVLINVSNPERNTEERTFSYIRGLAEELKEDGIENISTADTIKIPQELGMRLNYDKIIPETALRLFGPGQPADFGSHQYPAAQAFGRKGSITGIVYPLDQFNFHYKAGIPATTSGTSYSRVDLGLLSRPILGAVGKVLAAPLDLVREVIGKPLSEQMLTLGAEGSYIDQLDRVVRPKALALTNKFLNELLLAYKGLSSGEELRIDRYINEIDAYGASPIELTSKEKIAVDLVRAMYENVRVEQLNQGGPGILDNNTYREAGFSPEKIPSKMSQKVRRILTERPTNDPERLSLEADWIDHYQRKFPDMLPDEALAELNKYLASTRQIITTSNTPEFNAMRRAEGIGFPLSFRAPLKSTMMWYATRSGLDLAWYKLVQQDPIARRILGEPDTGWGMENPDVPVTWEDGTPVSPYGNHPLIEAYKNEWNIARQVHPDAWEKLNGIALSHLLGIKSLIRDVGSTMVILPGEYGITSTLKNAIPAIINAFGPRAYQAGAVRRIAGWNFNTPEDFEGAATRYRNAVQQLTGRAAVEVGTRKFLFEMGVLMARDKSLKDPGEFRAWLQEAIGDRWKTMTGEEIENAIGNLLVENVQGGYTTTGLAPWLLRGFHGSKGKQFLNATFSLARWPIERMNHFYNNVMVPAKKGDVLPLLRSATLGLLGAEGINLLYQWLFNDKPKEMTIEEWVNAGGLTGSVPNRETAYAIAAKLQQLSAAGTFSDLAGAAVQATQGEVPRNYSYPLAIPVQNVLMRMFQALQAAPERSNKIELIQEVLIKMFMDNTQTARKLWEIDKEDFGKREERIWRRVTGQEQPEYVRSNPFTPAAKLRQAKTMHEMKSLLPDLAAGNRGINISTALRTPSMRYKEDFYPFIRRMQGPEAEQARLQADLKEQELNMQRKIIATQADFQRRMRQFRERTTTALGPSAN